MGGDCYDGGDSGVVVGDECFGIVDYLFVVFEMGFGVSRVCVGVSFGFG